MIKSIQVLILAFLIPIGICGQSHIYWSSWGTNNINRCNEDGSGVTALVSTSGGRGISLDITGGKIYFCDGYYNNIRKSNLDGSSLSHLTIADNTSTREPVDIALDLINNIIYFTDNGNDKITKINFDGSGESDILTGLNGPQGIDYDKNTDMLYWVDSDTKTVNSVNSDGTNNQILISLSNPPIRLALDKTNQKIYWVERISNLIRRSDYDGSNVSTIASVLEPTGIAIDELNNKIYVNVTGSNAIKRMNFDGSGIETIFSNSGLSGIALNINQALPIELITFTGRSNGKHILLEWATQTEDGNAGFEIQRNVGNGDFMTIGEVAGAGNSNVELNYTFTDRTAPTGTNSYRLTQLDFSGAFAYSEIISVVTELGEEYSVQLFPNPTSSEFNLIASDEWEQAQVSLIDAAGRIVRQWAGLELNGSTPLSISGLPPAVYQIRIADENKVIIRRIVKR